MSVETMVRSSWLQCCLLLLIFSSVVRGFRPFSQLSPCHRRSHLPCSRQYSMISEGLMEWLKKMGVQEKNVKIKFSGSKVVANADIKQGDLIMSVPETVALNVNKVSSSVKSKVSASRLKTGKIGLTSLVLLEEKLAGEKSKYYEYIRSLPTTVPGILSWKNEELNVLYQSTTRKIESQIAAIEEDIQTIIDSNVFADGFDREAFLWAVGIVKSRSLFVKEMGDTIMVPGIDSIAFDPFSTSEPIYQGGGLFGTGSIKVLADRDYKAGEEIFISFGLKSSAECLEDHGIVPAYIDEDCSCELILQIDENDRFCDDKLNILEQEMLDSSLKVDLEADDALDFDPMLMRFARLKSIEGRDSFILEACFANTVWDQMSMPFSKNNEVKALQMILDLCSDALNNMAEDVTFDKGSNNPVDLAAKLRKQERTALLGATRKLEKELYNRKKETDKTEYYQERRLRELNLDRPLDGNEIVLSGDDPLPDKLGLRDDSWMR